MLKFYARASIPLLCHYCCCALVHLCTLSAAQRCPLGRFTQLTDILILLHMYTHTHTHSNTKNALVQSRKTLVERSGK